MARASRDADYRSLFIHIPARLLDPRELMVFADRALEEVVARLADAA